MKVFYALIPTNVKEHLKDESCLVFVPDNYKTGYSFNWDDFNYKTTCGVYAWKDNKQFSMGDVKLLLEDTKNTHQKMKEILRSDDFVDLQSLDFDYVSLPEDPDFYEKVEKVFPNGLYSYFSKAHDAGYIATVGKNKLLESLGFENSLLRELGARKAYRFARTYLGYSEELDVKFDIVYKLDSCSQKHVLKFDFTEGFYPSGINLMIGPNGVGKSQGLRNLITELFNAKPKRRRKRKSPLPLKPFFTNIVCFSYSPFEEIGSAINQNDVRSSSVFKSFGFYENGKFDLEKPNKDSLECLFDLVRLEIVEEKFNFDDVPSRIVSLKEILGIGIPDFDDIGVKVLSNGNKLRLVTINDKLERFIKNEDMVETKEGIIFLKDGAPIHLSSGQHMFAHLVIGALCYIKKETLLIFDEPELYLHPSLEIVLLRMLKALLERYHSYAVIATHSLVMSREVPQRCTSVIKRRDGNPIIERPPFETFGASMDRINSYVFDDGKEIKKYQEFLDQKYEKYGDLESVMDVADGALNEESILYLMGKE